MNLQQFLPVFRDTIAGLSFMHGNTIAHRDIKPANILKMDQNKYILCDYGVGKNLTFQEQYVKDLYYQKAKWILAGSP